MIERGSGFWTTRRRRGFREMLETREPLLINDGLAGEAGTERASRCCRRAAESVLFVPLLAGGQATGVISLQNIDRENAFSESRRALLVTLAGSLSVALENARLVHETRQRNAELALINSVQAAIAGELDPQAIYDTRRRQDPGGLRRAGRRHRALRRGERADQLPLRDRARGAARQNRCR